MSCSSCMADVFGPVLDGNFQNLTYVEIVRANETDPAVIACRSIRHDQNYSRYKCELTIDILDKHVVGRPPKRKTISSNHEDKYYKFNITINNSTCDNNSNKTEIEYHIYVSAETPMIITKCIVSYDPTGFFNKSSKNVNHCSSLSTLAIIPDDTSTARSPSPNATTTSPTNNSIRTLSSVVTGIAATYNETCGNVSLNTHGLIIGIIIFAFFFMIETALLLIICLRFVIRKSCKPKKEEPVEVITNHGYICQNCRNSCDHDDNTGPHKPHKHLQAS